MLVGASNHGVVEYGFLVGRATIHFKRTATHTEYKTDVSEQEFGDILDGAYLWHYSRHVGNF